MTVLYQHGTLELIMAGLYDGTTTFQSILAHGNTGIGTMDQLDGEVTVLNGDIYQTTSDGRTKKVDNLNLETPFISIHLESKDQINVNYDTLNFNQISSETDKFKNLPASIKLHGTFNNLKVRVAPKQTKPYPNFVSVSATQPTFEYKNIVGTLIGDFAPDLYTGIMANGWHLHFLSDDFNVGGHVLDFETINVGGSIALFDQLIIGLPVNNSDFLDHKPDSGDIRSAIEQAER
ncbi:acetolactate decarboxylase [Leuconostoc miyukkimchii]|uniref:acetolactate decarboxylase n=1 Tax=Leuconostoc miyukkimchii TaxID=910540 RepID=UPI001C7CF130|nr:acetolactate decarboxylase [Leuconostoc miyukkimchii]